MRRWLRASKLG